MKNVQSQDIDLKTYVQGICPACKSKNVSYGKEYLDPHEYTQLVFCESCNSNWSEYFKLVGVGFDY